MTATIDLKQVRKVLGECVELSRSLHGQVLPESGQRADARSAQINRQMLALADGLTLAASLVRNEYQKGRGAGHDL